MKMSDPPITADTATVFAFAMTFNGYERFGSFEACEGAARSGDRSTLELVRNELFFEARASRHRGDDDYVGLYAGLLPILRSFLAKGEA